MHTTGNDCAKYKHPPSKNERRVLRQVLSIFDLTFDAMVKAVIRYFRCNSTPSNKKERWVRVTSPETGFKYI